MADMRNGFMVFVAVATLGAYMWKSAKSRLTLLIGNVEAEVARNPGRVYLVALIALMALVAAIALL